MWSVLLFNENNSCAGLGCYLDSSCQSHLRWVHCLHHILDGGTSFDAHASCMGYRCRRSGCGLPSEITMGLLVVVLHLYFHWGPRVLLHPTHLVSSLTSFFCFCAYPPFLTDTFSLYSAFWHMDDFSWGATRQVSGQATKATKSRDETECSDRCSPMGFEVTADEFNQHTRRSSTQSSTPPRHTGQSRNYRASRPVDVDEELRKYSTITHHNPRSHPIDVDDITMDSALQNTVNTRGTEYNPNKYSNAEEAKRARRLRRGEC